MLIFTTLWVTLGLAKWLSVVVFTKPRFPFGLMDVILNLPLTIIFGPPLLILQTIENYRQ